MSTTVSDPTVPSALADLAVAAAEAAAPLVPAGETLVAVAPVAVSALDALQWPAGAVATVTGQTEAGIGLLVGADLADALAAVPSGPLDLGAALQPALDAAATAMGASVGAGQALSGADLASAIGRAAVAVPLTADGVVLAVLFMGAPAATAAAAPTSVRGATPARGVELLHGVAMEVTVELGRTRLSVRDLLALTPGDVLELDRAAGSPADLLVNGRLIARGEVVVVDEDFALRVTEIVSHTAAV